uniref:Insulin-like domain-containing protein n=1 Tax=Isometrus maculatus TaxID=497827 RepID=A0A0U1S632_ISOMC|nr:hypothetical protein [Isometrus maculatus]
MKTIVCFALLLLCLSIFLVNVCDCSPLRGRAFVRSRRIQVCGPQLADALRLICNGTYYTPSQNKRFVSTYNDLLNPYWNPVEKSYGNAFNRMSPLFLDLEKRGVADECCHKSCTFSQMSAYCATPPTADRQQERNVWKK